MGVIPLSFADPRYLVVEDGIIYKTDELTEELLGLLSDGTLRIVDLETMSEILADGTIESIPDIDDTEEIEDDD